MEYLPRYRRPLQSKLRVPSVIAVHGPLGVGKTSLLKDCQNLIQEEDWVVSSYVDLKDGFRKALSLLKGCTLDCDEVQVEAACFTLQTLAEQLEAKKTLELLKLRGELSKEIASAVDTELIEELGDALCAFINGFLSLGKIKIPPQIWNRVIKAGLGHFDKKRRRRNLTLLVTPRDVLTDAFLEDLTELLKSRHCVVFLDDLKATPEVFKEWLFSLIQRVGQEQSITWVIASWHDEKQISELVQISIEIESFREDELTGALGQNQKEKVKNFLEHYFPGSGEPWLPLLVDKIIDSIDRDFDAIDVECSRCLASSFKDWLIDDALFLHALTLAVPRNLDQKIAELLAIEQVDWDHFVGVGSRCFLSRKGHSYHLDPQLRYALLRHVQINQSLPHYFERHQPLVEFYQHAFDAHFQPQTLQLPSIICLGHGTPNWSRFVEWFYHALSSTENRDLGTVLITGLQYALFRVSPWGEDVKLKEFEAIVDVVEQVGKERHEDPAIRLIYPFDYAEEDAVGWNGEIRFNNCVKSLDTWYRILDQCFDQFARLDEAPDWEQIRPFFQTFTEMAEIDGEHLIIDPRTVAKAHYWLAVASYIEESERDEVDAQDHLEKIMSLSSDKRGEWWREIRSIAEDGIQAIREGNDWQC